MPYLQINCLRLYFEVAGIGHPILLLPPLSKEHTFLKQFAQALAKDYTVVSLDLLGHGLSDKPKEQGLYSYENLADQCHKLVEHLKIVNHHIVGMSWSGRIALTYALRHPEKVTALILIASSSPRQKFAELPDTSKMSDEEKFLTEIAWKMPYDVSHDLKKIQVPTLILVGNQDTRLEAARLMHASIQRSTMKVIEGFGHEMIGNEEICSKNILSWLRELFG